MTKAYEEIAAALHRRVVTGELEPGERLPTETMLASQFGVSRATVREALRQLDAQSLIRTSKGATGGSYVTLPSAGHLSASLRSGIGLLADAQDVSLDELLEARLLLEVPAARLAARPPVSGRTPAPTAAAAATAWPPSSPTRTII